MGNPICGEMDFFNCLKNIAFKWNESRLELRKERKVIKEIASIQKEWQLVRNASKPEVKDIKSLLIIDTLACYGDSLYVSGLIRELEKFGIIVGVVTIESRADIYRRFCKADLVASFENRKSVQDFISRKWDFLVDLCYMWNHNWNFRKNFVARIDCYSVVCAPSFLLVENNIYSDVLDLRNERHFGDKMARIVDFVTCRGDTKTIRPFYPTEEEPGKDFKRDYIYFNAVGGVQWRTLSAEQIDYILWWFRKKKNYVAMCYLPEGIKVTEDQFVRLARTKSFFDACSMVKGAKAVISPDTSIVHVAAAMDKPVLAFYCGNDLEISGKQMSEMWRPLSSINKVLIAHDVSATKRIPISKISEDEILQGLDWLEASC